ncbi:unnamed protein product [Gulo gulo]|uniref:Uncharacterized protein n=1 Tax=Gulo gulo TaxID=48420 RepID=A0A9X9LP86_GULGU|nr:unnamed protein product [Gulo gulo]
MHREGQERLCQLLQNCIPVTPMGKKQTPIGSPNSEVNMSHLVPISTALELPFTFSSEGPCTPLPGYLWSVPETLALHSLCREALSCIPPLRSTATHEEKSVLSGSGYDNKRISFSYFYAHDRQHRGALDIFST